MNPCRTQLKTGLLKTGLALLGLLTLLQLEARADQVSFSPVYLNQLKTADGQPMPITGLVILVASTNDGVFGAPTSSGFTSGDDIVLARWDLSANGTPGQLLAAAYNLTLFGGWGPGDPLAVYWFPTLTTNSLAPTNGMPYGFYRDTSAGGLDKSSPWITPGAGSTIKLNFKTTDAGGTVNPPSAGNASLEVGNQPPVANPDTFARNSNNPLSIAITNLLANDTDPENNPLTFTGVTGNSTNNITLSWDSNYVYYTNARTVPDRFTYTISDGHSVPASGYVYISITNSSAHADNIVSQIATNGSIQVTFSGIPGYTYLVQATTNLTPTVIWHTLSTNIANLVNGSFQYTDLQASNFVDRYYRATQP